MTPQNGSVPSHHISYQFPESQPLSPPRSTCYSLPPHNECPLCSGHGGVVTLQSNSVGWWLEAAGQRPEGNLLQPHTWSLLLCCGFVCPGILSRSVAHVQCVDCVCSRELLCPVPLWGLASVLADCRSCSPDGRSKRCVCPGSRPTH